LNFTVSASASAWWSRGSTADSRKTWLKRVPPARVPDAEVANVLEYQEIELEVWADKVPDVASLEQVFAPCVRLVVASTL
jgi:hypothetical protein